MLLLKLFPIGCIAVQNDSFFFRSSGGATLPLPAKALVVSQPVNAWYPGKAKQSSPPRLFPTCVKLMKRRRFYTREKHDSCRYIETSAVTSGVKCKSWSPSYSSVRVLHLPSSCNDRATFLRRISWGTVADVTSSDSVTVC